MGAHPCNKLNKCVCVYICISFFLTYIYLSHAALVVEEEQTAKQEVWMGEPVCGKQGALSPTGHPGTPRHA